MWIIIIKIAILVIILIALIICRKKVLKIIKTIFSYVIKFWIVPSIILLSFSLSLLINKNEKKEEVAVKIKMIKKVISKKDTFIKRYKHKPNCKIASVELSNDPIVFLKGVNQIYNYITLDENFDSEIYVKFDEYGENWLPNENNYNLRMPENNYKFWLKSDKKIKIIIAIYDE